MESKEDKKVVRRPQSVEEFLNVIFTLKQKKEEKEKEKNSNSESTTDDLELLFLEKEQEFLQAIGQVDSIPKGVRGDLLYQLVRLEKGMYEEDRLYSYTRFYRGQSDATWSLTPGIYRDTQLAKNEAKIFSDTISDFPEEFSNCETPFEQLVKMQHYSVPTRLLDVTTNPLVALFFACQEVKDKPLSNVPVGVEQDDKKEQEQNTGHSEGSVEREESSEETGNDDAGYSVVYVIDVPNYRIKYGDSDSVTILSTLAKYDHYWDENRFRKHTKPVPGYFTGLRFLHAVRETKPWFRSKIRTRTLCSVFCVKPKHANPRIIRQSGAFLLFGIDRDKGRDEPATLGKSGITVKRILIPKKSTKGILRELELLNISRASLFGDLDYYAEHIKDKYKEKQRDARGMKKES